MVLCVWDMEVAMDIDVIDVHYLMRLEDTIERATEDLCKLLDEECDLEIILLKELKNHPDIGESLSQKNKFMQLERLTDSFQVKTYVYDWMKACKNIKVAKLTLKQITDKRDSVKKKISLEPN